MTTTSKFKTILLGALLTVGTVTAATAEVAKTTDADLAETLSRLAATAELYRQRALSFTCEETIRWNGNGDDGRRRFGYVVAYDEETGFEDYRTRLKGGKKARPPKRVEPTDYGVPAYLRSVYLWPFIFKANRQEFHHYEIVGSDVLFDRAAVVIRFAPLAPYRARVNEWFGTAWIDRDTAQLLKVEARHVNEEREAARLARHRAGEAASSWTYHIEQITTEFTVEANGMRLPGKVELLRESHDMLRGLKGWNEGRRTVLWVGQTYENYRFFGVESNAQLSDPLDDTP